MIRSDFVPALSESAALVVPNACSCTSRAAIRAALYASVFMASSVVHAQDGVQADSENAKSADIVVTAQRREQNLQDVPLSVSILGAETLEQLKLRNFEDYVRFLPSVSTNGSNPGFNSTVVVRGIVADVGNVASGSLPPVGQYLDEQPITTIDGAPDMTVYDVARVEQLSGPQGTLFGASSMGGVLRIITKKPDLKALAYGVDVDLNKTEKGGWGGSLKGFVNIPLNDRIALRAVGWTNKRAGFIDNVPSTWTYSSGITVDNSKFARKDYNDSKTTGGRVALGIELGDNWTVTPSIVGQKSKRNGQFSYKPPLGDLKTDVFTREDGEDNWYQAALTVEGKIGDFDLIYAGAYMDRSTKQHVNYADYDYLYDQAYGIFPSDAQRVDDNGQPIDPRQTLILDNDFTKQSNELRLSSPSDRPFRAVIGAFHQRQVQDIFLNYNIPGLAAALSVSGTPGASWITSQQRIDRDYALFGQAEFDVVPTVTLTAGIRGYRYDNSLFGWFGGRSNERLCIGPPATPSAPCVNLGLIENGRAVPRRVKGDGVTYRLGVTWRITPENMIYFSMADGFRPGGTNRLGERGQAVLSSATVPYGPDTLVNYEVGSRNLLFDGRARLNVTLFNQEWRDIQLGIAINGVNLIQNVAKARSRGVELAAIVEPAPGLTLTINGAYIDAKLLSDYSSNGNIIAPAGARLAYSPRLKANAILRYEWTAGETYPFAQIAQTYQSDVVGGFSNFQRDLFGNYPAYGITDLSAGFYKGKFGVGAYASNVFDKRAVTYRSYLFFQQQAGAYQYVVQPRMVGVWVSYRY